MVTAFVNISVTPGSDDEVVAKIVQDNRVVEAWLTMGEYDILAIVETDNAEEINDFVNSKIKTIEGVLRTSVTFGIEVVRKQN